MRAPDGFPLSRRRAISERLKHGAPVQSTILAQEFGVSEDSIRRDLRTLTHEGLCTRVYGGALPMGGADSRARVGAKEDKARTQMLALSGLRLLDEDQTIFLDTGAATLRLAELLPANRHLRIVTNSLPAASTLMDRSDLSLFVVGGSFNPVVRGFVDAAAVEDLKRFRIDLCFLGGVSLTTQWGIFGFETHDASFKRALLDTAVASALMVANSAIDAPAPLAISPVTGITTYVLEHDAPGQTVSALRSLGCDVCIADAPAS